MADTMELMNRMILIFIVAAIVPGVVVLYNPGVMSYTERYREMAGFSGRIFEFCLQVLQSPFLPVRLLLIILCMHLPRNM